MWLLLILLVSIWMLSGRWKRRKMRQIAREIRSDIPKWPVIGHSYKYIGSDERRMKAISDFGLEAIKHGGSSHIWSCNKLYICIADPDVFELILKNCPEKEDSAIGVMYDTIGYVSSLAPVAIWRPRRKVLAPIFSLKILNNLVETFAEQSAILMELLKPTVGTGDVSLFQYLYKCTFEMITESSFGIKLNAQTKDEKLVRYIDQTLQIMGKRLLQPWLQCNLVFRLYPDYWRCRKMTNYATNFVDRIIKDKRKSIAANGLNKHDADTGLKGFLDVMVESTTLSDEAVNAEALFNVVAGTDTSATGAGFAMVLLSRYPTVQDAVYKELYEVFGNSDRLVTVKDLPKLKYMEIVLKETLRLYPPVPVISREVKSDVKLPSGTILVKGVAALLNIWSTHRNPQYWGNDAEQFRPERFLEGPLRHPAQFIVFSHGNRNCLGAQHAMMSMKTILATLLRSYRLLPPVGLHPNHVQAPLRVKYDLMLRHVDNFTVRLEKRI